MEVNRKHIIYKEEFRRQAVEISAKSKGGRTFCPGGVRMV